MSMDLLFSMVVLHKGDTLTTKRLTESIKV